ncbi:MAG: glycosyltransferase family 8 protein [Alphaproteobacteria bacterium]|nr:glycosyltransferase family 8 protein [Alphaproteobacteria bacterium]
MDKKINILYTFDTRFWRLAAVSMYSLLKNKKPDSAHTIYCMVAPHTRGKRQIQKIIQRFPNTNLVWRAIKKQENPFRNHDFSRWSPVIFYRLFAGKIFPNINKLLYLDSDTLIYDDVSELYNTDISKHTLAAVPDMAPREDPNNPNGKYVSNFAKEHLKNGTYFNSGVLLINTKKQTESIALLTQTKVKLKYPDQDILNVALQTQIKPLDLKYNTAPGAPYIPKHFSKKQATDATKHPIIHHFYVAKPYHYQYIPRDTYSAFYKAATAIGMHPDDFLKHEVKHLRRRNKAANQPSKTLSPLRVHNDKITFFGITIIRI